MNTGNSPQPEQKTLQDIMAGELFASSRSDLVETLKFMERRGTPLTERQVAAVALLKVLQKNRGHKIYEPIIETLTEMAQEVTDPRLFVEVIEKMTLGGFVTGKVRLSKIFSGGDK